MNSIEKSRLKNAPLKNAPLVISEDRSGFVAWATSVADGCISAGWEPIDANLRHNRNVASEVQNHCIKIENEPDGGARSKRKSQTVT